MSVCKKLASLVLFGAICVSFCHAAEEFPSRSVRIIVAYSAGGGNDLVARLA